MLPKSFDLAVLKPFNKVVQAEFYQKNQEIMEVNITEHRLDLT